MIADHNDGSAFVLLQVIGDHRGVLAPIVRSRCRTSYADSGGDGTTESFDFHGANGDAVVGLGTGVGRSALGRIEAHHLFFQVGLTTRRELTRVFVEAREAAGKKVTVERKNYVGFFEVVLRIEVVAESLLRTGANVVAAGGIVLYPLCLGVGLQELLDLCAQGWRRGGATEEAKARALHSLLRGQRIGHRADEAAPGPNVVVEHHGL